MKRFFTGIAYSFPVQLFLIHIKKNTFLLIFWVPLFGWIFKVFGAQYGVPFLFLDPEYLGDVTFWSYGLMGFGCGGFIMAYNIASYIMNAFRFPFLAAVAKPFFKYCLNNFFLPVLFNICFVWQIVVFQRVNEWTSPKDTFWDAMGFLMGEAIFILITLTYFFAVLKDFRRLFGLTVEKKYENPHQSKVIKRKMTQTLQWNDMKNLDNPDSDKSRRVDNYLSGFFSVSVTRNTDHYDPKMLHQVFRQNQFMAVIYVTFVLITIFSLGIFREVPYFEIPAAASIFLLLTVILMAVSAVSTFFKSWSFMVFALVFVVANFLSEFDFINHQNAAYGVDYQKDKAIFTTSSIANPLKDIKQDYQNTLKILDNWRKKNSANTVSRHTKPKMIFINTSGGGLRSAYWTVLSLQYADSLLDGQLLNHTVLISGSSGGMIGAAYLRELYLRKQLGEIPSIYDKKFADDAGLDLLNPIAFSIAINDLFVRTQSFPVGNKTYTKDRGYAFEKKLMANTRGYLNRTLSEYREPEKTATIPMMILSPSIINDGRTLYISPVGISYMLDKSAGKDCSYHPMPDAVEFSKMFNEQDADSLLFSSAIRMNATFPYILPVTSLPSQPAMDIMDAGINDNYGLATTMRFMYVFRDWISSNTSGVVVIQVRDSHKLLPIKDNPPRNIVEHLTNPLGNIYSNLFNMMDFHQDEQVKVASKWFDAPIDVIDFQLRSTEDKTQEEISMSLHLTKKEKEKVKQSIYLPENENSITRLKQLLE